jgi:hypothetical protein
LTFRAKKSWLCAMSAALSVLSGPTMAADDPDTTSDTVEVLGKREALRKTIRTFVADITRTDGDDLARWRRPICPAVSGISRDQGEYVRLRILQIAVLAGAPSARRDQCRSNLFVVLSPRPEEVLAAWGTRNPRVFGVDSREAIDSPWATAPVRVWHNAKLNNADGTPPKEDGVVRAREYRLKDSRIASSVAEDISSIVVLVDMRAIGTATLGQLADYVAMAALARIDLRANLASSATILRLFAPSDSESAPPGLTSWDTAFLKGLYGPHDPLLRPRAHIAAIMAQELAP